MALAPGFHRVDLKSKLGATPSSSAAIGVNNHGVVVGKYTLNGTNYGFVWDTAMPMTDGLGAC
jgi:hypothetical protein